MPRFFYEIDNGNLPPVHDDEGQEFADREAVHQDAVATLAEMARALPNRSSDQNRISASVRDETGKLIFTVTLSLDVQWSS
ncbi:DUF6894 family protein [Roseomonas sp. BN140053]|uniref:DUF6894 family protein n=1 Tax=Roseomonas sp. BN140053 TaxID=3391898 RepID=UPI0039EA0264